MEFSLNRNGKLEQGEPVCWSFFSLYSSVALHRRSPSINHVFCRKVTSVSIHSFVEWLDTFSYVLRPADVTVKEVNHIRCFAIDIAKYIILLSCRLAMEHVCVLFWILSELRYLDLHRRSASVNHVVTSVASDVSNCNTHKRSIVRRQERSITSLSNLDCGQWYKFWIYQMHPMSAPATQSVDSRARASFVVRSLLCPFILLLNRHAHKGLNMLSLTFLTIAWSLDSW
jgi:hypothetical protein